MVMDSSYGELVNKMKNIEVREIIQNEFPQDIFAARVGLRVDTLVSNLRTQMDNISAKMLKEFAKAREHNDKRFDKIELRLDGIEDLLGKRRRRRRKKLRS